MNTADEPLRHINYISVPLDLLPDIDLPFFDPAKLLPVEIPPGEEDWKMQDLSWEMIIAAMLKILAYKPDHEDGEYYREFIRASRPGIAEELTEAGIVKAQNKDYFLAEEVFLALSNLFPDDVSATINLALVFEQHADAYEQVEKNDLAEEYLLQAFKAYQQAVQIGGETPDVHYYFGQFYMRRNEMNKAQEHFSIFLETTADDEKRSEIQHVVDSLQDQQRLDTLFKESYDFIKIGKEEQGIERIREFLKLKPEVGNAWFLLGWAFRRLEKYTDAKEAFLKAIELEPVEPDAFNELAICLMELEEYPNCRKYLNKALRLEPENIKIISNMGILAMKEKKFEEAEGFFKTVLELEPEDEIARQYLEFLSSRQ